MPASFYDRKSTAWLGLACLGLVLACSQDPQDLLKKAQDQSRFGHHDQAAALYAKVLKSPGAFAQQAQWGRATALAAMRQDKDAGRSALLAAQGRDPKVASAARVLAMQCLAKTGDKEEARRSLEFWGPAALEDPLVRTAAVQLGLASPSQAPEAAKIDAPTHADLLPPIQTQETLPQMKSAAPTVTMPPLAAEMVPKTSGLKAMAAPAETKPQTLPSPVVNALLMEVAKASSVPSIDPKVYTLLTSFQDPRTVTKARSSKNTTVAWREKNLEGYWLFLAEGDETLGQLQAACKNAYQISWSPQGDHLLFTAMDWKRKERNIIAYEPTGQKARRIFKAGPNLSPLTCFSPDGSKVLFHYLGDLWVANADGIGRSLLNVAGLLGREVKEPMAYAWNKQGTSLALKEKGSESWVLIELKAP